jgi:hypothetical protein
MYIYNYTLYKSTSSRFLTSSTPHTDVWNIYISFSSLLLSKIPPPCVWWGWGGGVPETGNYGRWIQGPLERRDDAQGPPGVWGGGAGLAGGSRKRDSPTGAMRSSRAVMLVVWAARQLSTPCIYGYLSVQVHVIDPSCTDWKQVYIYVHAILFLMRAKSHAEGRGARS